MAINYANDNKNRVIVISIPDYAFTPFGVSFADNNTSEEIDSYNNFAKSHSENMNVSFINVTDISRMGLENIEFVASDGLHPSTLAYSKFVERLLPISIEKLN